MTTPLTPESVNTVEDFIAFVEGNKPDTPSARNNRITRAVWRSVAGLIELKTTDYAVTLTIKELTPAHFEETDGDFEALGDIGRAMAPEFTEHALPKVELIAVPDSPLVGNQGVEYTIHFPGGRFERPEPTDRPRRTELAQSLEPQLAARTLLALGVFIVETPSNDPTDLDFPDRDN